MGAMKSRPDPTSVYDDGIEGAFRSIRMWGPTGQRAPNKPLLLLLVLGQYVRGAERMLRFGEIEKELEYLLKEFGPPRLRLHTEFPFWYLQSDGIWEVELRSRIRGVAARGFPTPAELIRADARGGLLSPIFERVKTYPTTAIRFARALLDESFSSSIHADILAAVGLGELHSIHVQQPRDPAFRYRVLSSYGHSCAICGFDARLHTVHLGLDAAHIKWPQAGGPYDETNGLALCILHHKLFDVGGLTISNEYHVVVSKLLHGTGPFEDTVLRYHDRPIRMPINPAYSPRLAYIDWHHHMVFKGPARP
jgi:putative restriction endonuclease